MKKKKNDYVAPRVIGISSVKEALLQTVSFDPDKKGELDAKRMKLNDVDDSNFETSN